MIFPARIASLALVAFAVLLVALLAFGQTTSARHGSPELVVHCAAALRTPFAKIASSFEATTGIRIIPVYGPSEMVLASSSLGGGDIMIPADSSYNRIAVERGVATRTVPVTSMTPVLAVRAGNPLGIRSLDDLSRTEVRLAFANRGAAIGKLTHALLDPALIDRARTEKPTVTALATDLAVGSIDATILWDVVASQFESIEIVPVPTLGAAAVVSSASQLSTTSYESECARFLDYLSSPDTGFGAHGYAEP